MSEIIFVGFSSVSFFCILL